MRSCGVLLDGIPCPSDEMVGRRGSSLDGEVQTGIYESENSSVLLLPLHIWKEADTILRRSYDLDRHKKRLLLPQTPTIIRYTYSTRQYLGSILAYSTVRQSNEVFAVVLPNYEDVDGESPPKGRYLRQTEIEYELLVG